MMIFGGVPIMVVMPPRMLPNASGISISAGDRCCFLAVAMATGSIKASAPTLFIKAEANVTTSVNRPI